MDVRIGVIHSPRELNFEVADDTDADAVKADVESAMTGGSILWITDKQDRQIAVPGDKIAYVEIGAQARGRIGFAGS
ncbi:MAG: DUF3107 domain-containing protein [Actinomycetia bacterium]|nr:DUF3107 domain-containing protein [Actinomycetes bacterium]